MSKLIFAIKTFRANLISS